MANREHARPYWVNGSAGLDDPGRASPDEEAQESEEVKAGSLHQPAGQDPAVDPRDVVAAAEESEEEEEEEDEEDDEDDLDDDEEEVEEDVD